MNEIKNKILRGERALFAERGTNITGTVFEDGESPLKESCDITLDGCSFKWKYPLWYSQNADLKNCIWFENARAGVWYSDNISVTDSVIEAPKNFRRCKDLSLNGVSLPNASETLWNCRDVKLDNVTAKGDYFAMNSENISVSGLTLCGNYSFDGVKNAEIRSSKLLSKDAFWNSENITVYDSYISGEYLGWNSKNLRLVNCTIESLQGLCYIDGLIVENCRFINTTLAFEYSDVSAKITGAIDSILNPLKGTIEADEIGELIIDSGKVDPLQTKILCGRINKRSDAWPPKKEENE